MRITETNQSPEQRLSGFLDEALTPDVLRQLPPNFSREAFVDNIGALDLEQATAGEKILLHSLIIYVSGHIVTCLTGSNPEIGKWDLPVEKEAACNHILDILMGLEPDPQNVLDLTILSELRLMTAMLSDIPSINMRQFIMEKFAMALCGEFENNKLVPPSWLLREMSGGDRRWIEQIYSEMIDRVEEETGDRLRSVVVDSLAADDLSEYADAIEQSFHDEKPVLLRTFEEESSGREAFEKLVQLAFFT